MKKILVRLYQLLSPNMKKRLGNSKVLKPIRDRLLRSNGEYIETDVFINRSYNEYTANFRFFSAIQIAAKAKNRGIENTLIKNSMTLLQKRKFDSNKYIIFDVGSNFGYLSLTWATTIAKKGKTIAFEPNLRVLQSFRKSVLANGLGETVVLENVALGNENKDIKLYNFNTTSNILETFDPVLIQTKASTVQMIKLDDYVVRHNITRLDLLKIDVDGIELEILKGAKQLIKKLRPIIIVEVNEKSEIIDFLLDNNYKILNLKMENYSSKDFNSNLFGVPIECY